MGCYTRLFCIPLILWLCVFCCVTHAAESCYQWKQGGFGWRDSQAAVAADVEAYCRANEANGAQAGCGYDSGQSFCPSGDSVIVSYHVDSVSLDNTGALFPDDKRVKVTFVAEYTSGMCSSPLTPGDQFFSIESRADPSGCSDPCVDKSGIAINVVTADAFSTMSSGACRGGCALTALGISASIDSAGGFIAYMEYTGAQCSSENASNTAQAATCTSAVGTTACTEAPAKNCGTFNGDEVCIESVSVEHPCVVYESGGVACLASAATPPAPNNGTTGVKAEPTGSVQTSTTAVNYYNGTVVNNSTSTVITNSTGSHVGNAGSGSSSSSGGSESGTYVPGGQSDFYTKKTDTFGSVLGDFKNSVSNAPFMTAANGFFTVSVGGSCPTWSASVWVFGAITIDHQCSAAMASIWPYIAAVVLATAAFFAFRIAFL